MSELDKPQMERMRLERGCKVVARFTDHNGLVNGLSLTGILQHLPIGEGDTIQIRADDGQIFLLNPYCASFIGLRTVEPENDDE